MLESGLERGLVETVKKMGGKAYKWVSPGEIGVPDRIVILPGGKIIFVELKRPGRTDGRSPRQKKIFEVLTALGCRVWLINDLDDFKARARDLTEDNKHS